MRIRDRFARAQVGFKLLGGPIAAHADIFQMDLHTSPRWGEYVRVWPGAPDNLVNAVNHDATFRQVLLRVKEPPRTFTRTLPLWGRTEAQVRATVEAQGGRVVAVWRDHVVAELVTPAHERRYLCGLDDVKLFIAEVPAGDTVRDAHEALKPPAVRAAEARGPVQRQGEWFFIPPRPEELERLAATATAGAALPSRPVGPAEAGRAHVADELIRTRRRRGATPAVLVHARGVVRHVDHRPLELDGWRRVVVNREVREPLVRGPFRRNRWID